MTPQTHGLPLAQLLVSGAMRSVRMVRPPNHDITVERVAFIEDLEQMRTCRPGTVVVLHRNLARSAWAVSVAVRYAWERHLPCLVAQLDTTSASSAIRLSDRLDVPLGNLDHGDLAELALALAIDVGAPGTVSTRVLATIAMELSLQDNVDSILEVLRAHLPGTAITLATGHGREGTPRPELSVDVPLGAHDIVEDRWLHAQISVRNREWADLVRNALTIATAPIIAVQARSHLTRIEEHRAQAWLLELGLTGRDGGPENTLREIRPEWFAADAVVTAMAVCRDDRPITDALDLMVAQTLGRSIAYVGPIRYADGWAMWRAVPALREDGPDGEDHARQAACKDLRTELERRLRDSALGIDLAVGLGPTADRPTELDRSLRLARLGAEAARRGGGMPYVASFGEAAAVTALPVGHAQAIADEVLGPLRGVEDSGLLLETLATFLDVGGSTTGAAEALGVHRNTVTSRLARMRVLGIDVDRPEARLGLHLAAHLARTATQRSGDAPPEVP